MHWGIPLKENCFAGFQPPSPRPKMNIRIAPNGFTYLNAGCGDTFSPEWNNVDRKRGPQIVYHNLLKPLPYPDNTFDAVYSSHVLEHLEPEDGDRFLQELFRTCKPGGVCRIVVPDYEQVCREYLQCIQTALDKPDEKSIRRYHWSVLEMIDQLIRDKCGGRMQETLFARDFDEEYVRYRCGEEFSPFYASGTSLGNGDRRKSPDRRVGSTFRMEYRGPKKWKEIPTSFIHRLFNWLQGSGRDPRKSGEAHRWVYDRFGLKLHMEKNRFEEVKTTSHNASRIPHWSSYLLDSTLNGSQPRKPDSLYMEGIKPLSNRK
jgi:predicted SAM-dependent methyltransferase